MSQQFLLWADEGGGDWLLNTWLGEIFCHAFTQKLWSKAIQRSRTCAISLSWYYNSTASLGRKTALDILNWLYYLKIGFRKFQYTMVKSWTRELKPSWLSAFFWFCKESYSDTLGFLYIMLLPEWTKGTPVEGGTTQSATFVLRAARLWSVMQDAGYLAWSDYLSGLWPAGGCMSEEDWKATQPSLPGKAKQ